RALKTAAALGDLSENADYQAARERQDFVRVRLGQLKQRLADLSMINFDKIPRDRISLGSKVVLLDVDKNEEIRYKLVTSEDANAPAGLISTTSPIGRSLLNKHEGDTVEVKIPSGTRTFEIVDGEVARRTKRDTKFGAFFDSVIDRYSDLLLLLGLIIWYAKINRIFYVGLTGLVLIGSVLTSYTRARAESLIAACKVGFLERPERIVLLIIGSLWDRMAAALWVM